MNDKKDKTTVRRFWNFARDETTGERELFIDAEIAGDLWFGNEITPQQFRDELFSGAGDITLWISSPGGDVFAAAEMYAMLMDYRGDVTVKVYGLCASAATVVAMAGTKVLMSPTAMMLIHNPWTVAIGDKEDMRKAGAMLDAVKESIINAYEIRTGLPRAKLSRLMDLEEPMDAHYAIALGFADGLIENEKAPPMDNASPQTTVQSCYARLNLLSGGRAAPAGNSGEASAE